MTTLHIDDTYYVFANSTTDHFTGPAGDVFSLTTAVDLFAGPGGWDEGARMLGERTGRAGLAQGILGFEFEANAVATARAAGHARVYGDLASVNPAFFKAPGLIASPPCQGFSPAGKGRGREDFNFLLIALNSIRRWLRGHIDAHSPERAIEWLQGVIADEKSALILEPIRWALRMADRPRWLAFEQVKTCLPIWEAMADLFRDLGYSVWTGLVHSEEYGVGQTRTRAVLLGSLDRDVSDGPTPTHLKYALRHKGDMEGMRAEAAAKGLKPWVSMAEAVAEGTWKPRAANEGTTDEDMQWAYERPSVTMVASYRPDVAAAPKYRKAGDGPRQNAHGSISVTPQESGMIQSFPADYPWQGPATRQYQQSGNAVPCLMAAAMIETVAL